MKKKLKLTTILERRKKDWMDMGPPSGPDPRFDDDMSKHMGFRSAINPPTPHGKLRAVVGHPDFSDEDDFGMAEEELEMEDPDLEEADKYPSSIVKKYPQGYDPSGKLVKEKTKYPTSGEQYPGKLKKINEKTKYPAKGKMYPEKAEMKLESLFIKEGAAELQQQYGTHIFRMLNMFVQRAVELIEVEKNSEKAVRLLQNLSETLKEMHGIFVSGNEMKMESLFKESDESAIKEDFGGEETEKNVPDRRGVKQGPDMGRRDGDLMRIVQKAQLAAQHADRLIKQGREKEAKALLGRLHQLLMSKLG